ncbi:uncharacterized protein M421DRAFT_426235, partial [Didymella exigua CBS 183.55]
MSSASQSAACAYSSYSPQRRPKHRTKNEQRTLTAEPTFPHHHNPIPTPPRTTQRSHFRTYSIQHNDEKPSNASLTTTQRLRNLNAPSPRTVSLRTPSGLTSEPIQCSNPPYITIAKKC